jgi:S-layer protein (TIGR01567 family)
MQGLPLLLKRIRKISLANGTHNLKVWGKDNFGNWNSTELRVISVSAPSTDRIVGGGSGTGSVAYGPSTWTASNFPGFWHEDGISGETLSVNQHDLSETQRVIDTRNLVYSTTKMIVPYKVYTETGLTVWNGLDASGYRVMGGGYYAKIGWLGKPFVAVNGQAFKLSEIILEQNSTDFKNLNVTETWNLGNGYNLRLNSLDTIASPKQAWFILSNKSETISDFIVEEGNVITITRNLAGESDAPFFVTYVDNISENSVRLKYTWLISDNVTIFNGADIFGNMELVSASTDGLSLSNENPLTLSRGSTVNLLDSLNLVVNDKQSLEYYPVMSSGVPSITGITITPTNPSAGNEINITVAINNPGASFNGRVEGNVWAPDGTGKYLGWKNVVIPSGASTVTIIGPAGGVESSYITHQAGTYLYDVFLENVDQGQVYINATDSKLGVPFTVGAAASVYMSNIVLSASPTDGSLMTLNVTISNPTSSAFTGTMDANIWDSVRGYALTPKPISIASGGSTTLTFSYTPVNHGVSTAMISSW